MSMEAEAVCVRIGEVADDIGELRESTGAEEGVAVPTEVMVNCSSP
jgi:hypothetical protein